MAVPLHLIISPLLTRMAPGAWRCSHLALTGSPCPFCGLTEAFRGFFHLREPAAEEHPLLRPILLLLAAETFIRAFFTLAAFRFPFKALPVLDGGVHLLLGVVISFA